MFDKSSNFNIHGGTFIDTSGGTCSSTKDSKDYQTIALKGLECSTSTTLLPGQLI